LKNGEYLVGGEGDVHIEALSPPAVSLYSSSRGLPASSVES